MKFGIVLRLLAITVIASPAHASILQANVERTAPETLTLNWTDTDPVDVFESDKAGFSLNDAKPLVRADRTGHYIVPAAGFTRHYFALVDTKDHHRINVAERLLPLMHGSNFRDVGGYPAAGGKHIRWGLIYRSGATPLLSDSDMQEVKALGLKNLIDLRSSEERVLAPTRIEGVPYAAVGYPMTAVTGDFNKPGGPQNGASVYRNFPTLLAPQLRLLFADLLSGAAPIAYNCSAGQDRTGFATAVILTALGVPRDVILADYHLSTRYRQPQYEMPKIDTVAQANNPTAMFFARGQQSGTVPKPKPLMDPDGKPFLAYAFEEIDARWGSVDRYLEEAVGVDKASIAKLRSLYLE